MTFKMKAALLVMLLGTAACTNPDRFDNAGAGGPGAGGPGSGIETSVLDPTSAEFFNQSVGNTVRFAVDQSTLSPEARTTLNAQAQWLMSNPTYIAVIEGHADEQGTREYNLALGARRSAAVRDYLVAQGVATNRLQTLTYGKERPLAACSTEECYAQNRRAVTVLSVGGVS